MNEIKIRCKGSEEITLDELIIIQGDLKDLSEENYLRMKDQMIELGFIAPFFIWKNGEDKCLIDGTQRCSALRAMQEVEDIILPKSYPMIEIEADDKQQAMRMILAISSNYGEMTTLSLEGFLLDAEITLEDAESSFHFDAINFNNMADVEHLPPEEKKKVT